MSIRTILAPMHADVDPEPQLATALTLANGEPAIASSFLREADEPTWAERIEANHG